MDLTIEELKEILFVIRVLEKSSAPGTLSPRVLQATATAKYALQDVIERHAAKETM